MSRTYNLADLFEIVVDSVPDRVALVAGAERRTYRELDDRANRLANHLHTNGIGKGDHIAVHATNCVEWVESWLACFKLSAVPINVNYRYVQDELRYLYDNADCVAVIVEPQFLSKVSPVLADLPAVRLVLEIGPEYEAALAGAANTRPNLGRSNDDLYMLYTGGTTGMPKGVMWRHEDAFFAAMNSARGSRPLAAPDDLKAELEQSPGVLTMMAIGPMMHGGSQWMLGNAVFVGGKVVLYCEQGFSGEEVLRLVDTEGVNSVSTIGDAMAGQLPRQCKELRRGPSICPPCSLSATVARPYPRRFANSSTPLFLEQ
jgi:3-oxocholest-4-en-26-oate---CoA ligase